MRAGSGYAATGSELFVFAVVAVVRSVIESATSCGSSAIGTWPHPNSGTSSAPGIALAKRGAVSAPIITSRVPKQMRAGTRMSSKPVGTREAVVEPRVE